jgi:hypothetical protein
MSQDARSGVVESLIVRLRTLYMHGIVETRRTSDRKNYSYTDPDNQYCLKFLRTLLDARHAGAHIHLLNAWRKWRDHNERAAAERPDFVSGKWYHAHYSPYSAREESWCIYVERWLRVIAGWPMQTSFVENASRLEEALRVASQTRRAPGPPLLIYFPARNRVPSAEFDFRSTHCLASATCIQP